MRLGDGWVEDDAGNARVFAVTAAAVGAERAPDPSAGDVRQHCPLCDVTYPDYDSFAAHARPCIDAHPEKVAEAMGRG